MNSSDSLTKSWNWKKDHVNIEFRLNSIELIAIISFSPKLDDHVLVKEIWIEIANIRQILEGTMQRTFLVNNLNLEQKINILNTIEKRRIIINGSTLTIQAI